MIDRKNFYINGQWVNPKSKEEIKVVNPATEQDCAVIALANKDDVNDAVVAAKMLMILGLSHQKKKEFNY
jgi:aldehyde dehydrogenase (NAD+)